MSPRRIVREAKRQELDIIGICDHNSCENVPYVQKSAERQGLSVIAGMEICSREEVHLLALFDDEQALFSMQKIVYDNLCGTNDENLYGDQIVVNENDEVVDFNRRLLIGATDLSIENIVDCIHERDGLAIAAHVDREGFGLLHQLGFVPEGLQLDALEVSSQDKVAAFQDMPFPVVRFSDAHTLDAIAKNHTSFSMERASLEEIKSSLRGEGGRKVVT